LRLTVKQDWPQFNLKGFIESIYTATVCRKTFQRIFKNKRGKPLIIRYTWYFGVSV